MRKNIFLILFFCLLLVYIVFFPHKLKKELIFIPSWGLEADSASVGGGGEDVPFEFDSRLGYFNAAGEMKYSEDVGFKAAVSDELFINYSSVSERLVFQKPDGDVAATVKTEDFPFFIGSRLFTISPDRMVVTEYDYDGNELLKLSAGSAVTSMDASDKSVIIGMLNGKAAVYPDTAEAEYTYFSTDSRYSIVYACAMSDDGERFAAVTGLYPQQLACFEFRNEEWVPVFRMNTGHAYRRNLLLDYSSDGRLLYIETPDGLDIYSTATFLKKEVELAGDVKNADFSSGMGMSFITAEGESGNLLRVYRADLGTLADLYFPAGDIYFYPDENCFYVGVNSRILRYDIIEG